MTDVSELCPRMPARTRYAGEPVDLSSRRSVELPIVSGQAQQLSAEDSCAVVDHFFHEGTYWRALIHLDGVGHVRGQSINFSKPRTKRGPNGPEILRDELGVPRRTLPMLNHLQTRVTMLPERPVELYQPGTEIFANPEHTIDEFVYTIEAVGPAGVEFNLRDAVCGNLLSVHRFLSLQEMAFERLVVLNQWILESPPLPLTSSQTRALLVASLNRAHRAGLQELYYMIGLFRTSNCTSHPFRILDSVVDYRWPQRLGSMLYRLPLSPRFYLRIRGLDADPTLRKIFRDEFADFLQLKATQQRKRDYVRQRIASRRARDAQSAPQKSRS